MDGLLQEDIATRAGQILGQDDLVVMCLVHVGEMPQPVDDVGVHEERLGIVESLCDIHVDRRRQPSSFFMVMYWSAMAWKPWLMLCRHCELSHQRTMSTCFSSTSMGLYTSAIRATT